MYIISRGSWVRIINKDHEYYNVILQIIDYERWHQYDNIMDVNDFNIRYSYQLLLNKNIIIVVEDEDLEKVLKEGEQ